MDLEGISRATNSNQMKGQNPIVVAMLARRFGGKDKGRRDSGEGKKDWENEAKMAGYQSELRSQEESNKAWIQTQASERAAAHSEESMPRRIKAMREASEIKDEEGNVLGEINVSDTMHGMSSRGYMRSARQESAPAESAGTQADNAAAAQTVAAQASSQQGTTVPGWGASTTEPSVTSTQLRSAMARGPKKRVTKKAEKQTQLTFSDADTSNEQ